MTSVTIKLPESQKDRLTRLAIRYGLSLPEFTAKVLSEISDDIPEESFEDYDNPEELKASFYRALEDYKAGRVSDKL